MSELDIITPEAATTISFSPEPAYNALCSMVLLNADLSGFDEWVDRTAASLSPGQKRANKLVAGYASDYLGGVAWPSFPAWLADIEGRDPDAMRQRSLERLLDGARSHLDAGYELPTPAELLFSRDAFLSLLEAIYDVKGSKCDHALCEEEYDLLQDPGTRQNLLVTHLRQVWDGYLAQEWEQKVRMVRESVAAYQTLDFSGSPTEETVRQVIARERIPDTWRSWLPEVKHIVFAPSPHIGPYVLLMDTTGSTARVAFGARIPKGASVVSPTLSRSELLVRLSALADDTRLQILDLLSQEGELRAQDIIDRLGISQSSASRHLSQLAATGYLHVHRCEGAKCYSLKRDRIDDTLGDLKRYLRAG